MFTMMELTTQKNIDCFKATMGIWPRVAIAMKMLFYIGSPMMLGVLSECQ